MTTETEAAIEFTMMHLERVLPGAMQESKVEIQIRLEILATGLLEPVFPEAYDGKTGQAADRAGAEWRRRS